jgi:hypothetical protein
VRKSAPTLGATFQSGNIIAPGAMRPSARNVLGLTIDQDRPCKRLLCRKRFRPAARRWSAKSRRFWARQTCRAAEVSRTSVLSNR